MGLLPAVAHNVVWDGELLPVTSQAGQNFYTGSHPGNPHGGYHVPDFVRRTPRFEEADFATEAKRRAGRELTPGQISRYWGKEGWRALAAEPLRGPVLFARKLGLLYHRLEIPDDEDIRFFRRYAPVLRLPLPGFGPFGVLGLAGLALALRRRAAPPDVVLFVATYSMSVALFFVFSRYRLPLVGPLAIFRRVLPVRGFAGVAKAKRSRARGRRARVRAARLDRIPPAGCVRVLRELALVDRDRVRGAGANGRRAERVPAGPLSGT